MLLMKKNPTNLVDTNNTIVPCFDRVSCISTAVGFCSSREAEIYIYIYIYVFKKRHPGMFLFLGDILRHLTSKGENGGKTLGMGAP